MLLLVGEIGNFVLSNFEVLEIFRKKIDYQRKFEKNCAYGFRNIRQKPGENFTALEILAKWV